MLGEEDTFGISGNFGILEKSLVLILVKQRQNYAWACITMVITVICLLTGKKSIRLKQIIKMPTFQINFV